MRNREGNDRVLGAGPRIKGLATANPWFGPEAVEELRRVVRHEEPSRGDRPEHGRREGEQDEGRAHVGSTPVAARRFPARIRPPAPG